MAFHTKAALTHLDIFFAGCAAGGAATPAVGRSSVPRLFCGLSVVKEVELDSFFERDELIPLAPRGARPLPLESPQPCVEDFGALDFKLTRRGPTTQLISQTLSP